MATQTPNIERNPILTAWLSAWRLLPAWFRGLIRTMRLSQWTKNGFIFIPVLFDRQLTRPESFLQVLTAFSLFCLMSSSVYVLNDLVDVERDRAHPKKSRRPIPSGQLPIPIATIAAVLIPITTFILAIGFSPALALILAVYYGKDLLYSFWLKNMVVVDVMLLAAGFILRVMAGTVVITVTSFSPWLYVCVGMLALFLAVGKRRQELMLLGDLSTTTRPIFREYNLELLNDMLRVVTTGSIMSYTLYTVEAQTSLAGPGMLFTVPFVVYGIFRYLYLIHVRGEGSAPDELLFKDRALLISVVLFVIAAGLIIYVLPRFLPATG